jgi:hypothetical protein
MGQVGPGVAGSVVATLGGSQLELGAVGLVALLAIALLIVKLKFSHDRQLRIAASAGYHHRDVARYTQDGVGLPEDPGVDPRTIPLAPSFVASARGRSEREHGRHRSWSTSEPAARRRDPRPTVPYGSVDPGSGLPPAFDREEAERHRPPGGLGLATAPLLATAPGPEDEPPQEVPVLEGELDPDDIPPPAGALPLLSQPPPPPDREPTSTG